MKLSDEEIGKLSATCDGPSWSYDLVRKAEALLLSKIAAERDELLFKMRYILAQTNLGHIHDTASSAIESILEASK